MRENVASYDACCNQNRNPRATSLGGGRARSPRRKGGGDWPGHTKLRPQPTHALVDRHATSWPRSTLENILYRRSQPLARSQRYRRRCRRRRGWWWWVLAESSCLEFEQHASVRRHNTKSTRPADASTDILHFNTSV